MGNNSMVSQLQENGRTSKGICKTVKNSSLLTAGFILGVTQNTGFVFRFRLTQYLFALNCLSVTQINFHRISLSFMLLFCLTDG